MNTMNTKRTFLMMLLFTSVMCLSTLTYFSMLKEPDWGLCFNRVFFQATTGVYLSIAGLVVSKVEKINLKERFAAHVHDGIWSYWMKYMFTQGTFNDDGSWTMPVKKVERWTLQMKTPYWELSEDEKGSDRRRADELLQIMEQQNGMD